MHAGLTPLQIAAFVTFALGAVSLTNFVRATVSGWRRLAQRYAAGALEPGRRMRAHPHLAASV
ncbi:hypothetical protein GCM10012319_40080 [Comamonas sp. KCTC 72670]|nr:hypothetical protein GCM10012319_40080 [Comamonas sp. KCTC 72670]